MGGEVEPITTYTVTGWAKHPVCYTNLTGWKHNEAVHLHVPVMQIKVGAEHIHNIRYAKNIQTW